MKQRRSNPKRRRVCHQPKNYQKRHWLKNQQKKCSHQFYSKKKMPVLNRTETIRFISELEVVDQEKVEIQHDPWLPLEVLVTRSKYFYSMKRALKNSAIIYEKLIRQILKLLNLLLFSRKI